MALITQAPKGTQDVLPKDSYKWQFLEDRMVGIAKNYGFSEIRTPVFEHTELFQRGVGETTDVVQKEMYTFKDKGDRSITLRPEGTAGAVRAMLEHSLYNEGLPVKVCYKTSCYRYEKPQAGRYREFHQFGVEMFGTAAPIADAEIICMANSILQALNITNVSLELNSIGCPTCRAKYHQALKEYFAGNVEELCDTCRSRLERNPMRILDCKSPICSKIAAGAPVMLDYLCDDCHQHFESVKQCLTQAGIDFVINPTIVRGLDYYTRTVFEFVSNEIGAQGTILGGGRYDGLVKEMGGQDMPSLGYAIGLERVLLLMEKQGIELPQPDPCLLYIASMGAAAQVEAFRLVQLIRDEGFHAECDNVGRSLKAQMKYADKIGAQFSLVLGDSELESGTAKLKNMKTGEQDEIALSDLMQVLYQNSFNLSFDELVEQNSSFEEEEVQNLIKNLGAIKE